MRPSALPQPISTFVGRVDQRARLGALLADQVVCLIYGVAGIGKTELCYRVAADARAAGPLAGAPARLWRATAGAGLDEAIAGLRAGAGDRRAVGDGHELELLIDELEARPALLVIDDAHHADPGGLGRLLATLARHVTRSRVLVTSRVELALPDDAPPLATLHLEPLVAAEIAELGARVGALRGGAAPDPVGLFERSAGSPFRALRAIATPLAVVDDDALAAELAALPAPTRHALLIAALGGGRLRATELGLDAAEVAALTRHFLLDVERGAAIVHDLIRDALVASAPPAQREAAHQGVAAVLFARADTAARPLELVAAIQALIAAAAMDAAWAAYRRHVDVLVAAGVGHLLLEPLRALRRALPAARLDIDLARAQTLLSRSRIAEARALLVRAARMPPGRTSARCLRLLGTALVRAGRLGRAEDAFRDALARAAAPPERFEILVEIANVRSLRGDGDAARAVLAEARRAHPTPTARERRLARHARTLSWTYQQRFAEAAHTAARSSARGGNGAFALRLLELIGRAESGDLAGARRIEAALRMGTTADPRLVAHAGALRVLQGDLAGGLALLERHQRELEAGAEHTFALMAGYYLGVAWTGLGAHDRGSRMLERTCARARETGMATTAAQNQALAAVAALEGGRLDAARADAVAVRGLAGGPVYARFWAGVVLARLAALDGDVAAARAALEVAIDEGPGRDRAPIAALGELERAELELLGGDPGRALARAGAAAHLFGSGERRLLEARARVIGALALASTGQAADRVLAGRELAEARALAAPRGYGGVLARIALVDAALRRAAGDEAGANACLDAALAVAPTPTTALDTQLLRAARAAQAPAGMPVGLERLIAALGFRGAPRYQVRGRDGQIARASEARAPVGEHDLVIDLPRHAIDAPLHGRGVRGYPVACALLAHLVANDPAVVGPEPLYLGVWRGREYHPLRHRNTVYVGISRLRRALAQLLPGQTVIETTPTGWRLATGVRAVVIDVAPPS